MKTLAELTTEVETLTAQNKKLAADLGAEQGKVTKLEGEKTALAGELATEKQTVATLTGEKQTLSTELATEKQAVATLKGEAKSAEQRAVELAAAAGVKPGQKPAEEKQGGGDILEQFAAITDPGQRTQFYAKNKAAIWAADAAKKKTAA